MLLPSSHTTQGEGSEGHVDVDDEDGSEEYDSDEEEEEDEEPVLKYERMGGSTHELLGKDSASMLAVSTKFFVSARASLRSGI